MNTRKLLTNTGLALATVLAGLTFTSPAQAAGTCTSGGAALAPIALFPGSFVLRNVKTKGYTGTPFSFRLKMARGGFPGQSTYYQWYTYNRGYKHTMETGALRAGAAVEVQTWCGGRRGGDWVGKVYSK